MNKKEKIKAIVEALKLVYPEAKCSLQYENEPWKLLVMGPLSAQCTDERVNLVCADLFARFPMAKELADAPLSEIENRIRSCGLYHNKAKNVKLSMQRLVYQYDGVLPQTMEELLTFEGVGRKVANLLLGDLFHQPAFVADTHAMRICGRFGMVPLGKKDPVLTERVMKQLIEPSEQSDFCHRLVLFGRETCKAQNPQCETCPIRSLCQDS